MHVDARGGAGADRIIRVRFRFVVGLLCVALVSVSVWSFLSDRRSRDARTTNEATLLAQALSKHAGDLMALTDLLQFEIGKTVRAIAEGRVARASATLEWSERLERIDAIQGICAFDRAGRVVLSTDRDCARAPDLDWFNAYPAIGGTIRQIGQPFQSADGSQWLIPTLHLLYDERARPAGLVVVTLRSTSLVSVYEGYGADQRLGLVFYRADGMLLTRFPARADLVGRSFANAALLRPAFSRPSGVIMGVSPLDQIERIRSFQRVPGTALIVVVGLQRETFALWSGTGLVSALLLALLIVLVFSTSRQLDRYLLTTSDSRERLQIQARTDALTGMPNRRAFDEAIVREWRAADQNFTSLSMLLLDVDHFKSFNDTYGHQAGDECLRRVAFTLRQASFETVGHLARYGGEEFALLLIDVTPAVAMLTARHLRAQIEAMAIPHAGNESAGVVTVSIGVSTLDFAVPLGDATPISLVAEADQALYDAKRTGRNRVEQFPRPVAEPAVRYA